MPRLFLAVALFANLAGVGCKSTNAESCDLEANKTSTVCLGIDAGPVETTCKTDGDCAKSPGDPVCDTAQKKCVPCTTADNKCDATSTAPRCDATDTCVACIADADCSAGAGACLPTGACATPDTIIHAASTGTAPQPGCGGGGGQQPCSLEDALALATAEPTKKVIRLDDNGTYTPTQNNYVVNANITIEAGTATLHHKNDGPVLMVTNGKSLTLLGGIVENATGNGNSNHGIQCNASSTLIVQGTTIQNNKASAIDSQGCTVTVTGAKLQNNSSDSNTFPGVAISGGSITISRSFITGNKGGGISTISSASFQIVGNAILANGGGSSQVGGVAITQPPSAGSRLDFNTIAANNGLGAIGAGVQCLIDSFTAQNNIIWDNSSNQLNGCTYAYSVIGPTAVSISLNGGNNTNTDPKLKAETTDPHLQTGSSAIGAANPNADLTGIAAKDIDGDARKKTADCGADQITK